MQHLFFITKTECVHRAVRSKTSYIIQVNFLTCFISFLTPNGRNIPLANPEKYLGAILDRNITRKAHKGTIETKAFRTFIIAHSQIRNERLSLTLK